MKEKHLFDKLDEAIDRGDIFDIEAELNNLEAEALGKIEAEDPLLFSAKIKKTYKEKNGMKLYSKTWKIAVAAALVAAMGVTAYAAGVFNRFSFVSAEGDKYVTVRTTEAITEDQAKEIQILDATEEIPEEARGELDRQDLEFDSVEHAESEMGYKMLVPAKMPKMNFDEASGNILAFGDGVEQRTTWLNYSDDNGRVFGVTVVKNLNPNGISVSGYSTNDMDEGSFSVYNSKSGYEFDIFTESDSSGGQTAYIAVTYVGDYEYGLVFMGFDEADRNDIIDSVNLSEYK